MKYNSFRWLLCAVVALGACADGPSSPAIPLANPQYSHDDDNGFGWGNDDGDFGRDPDLRYIASFKTKPAPPDPLHDHAMIGPAGGSLRVGDFEIIVPAGAVSRPTTFRIKVPVDPKEATRAFAEFSPHMIFNKPVTVILPAAATTADDPVVLWWVGYFWLPFQTTPTSDGRIQAKTWHFSTYGTSASYKGITILGG